LDREQIRAILPHREPMLLVDQVEVRDGTAYGVYQVRGDEWFLQGHFPGNPVVPGVILCEIMAQSCALLLADRLAGKTPYYAGIDKARFQTQVHPGDTVLVTAELTRQMGNFYFAHCTAKNQREQQVCKGDLSFALVEGRN